MSTSTALTLEQGMAHLASIVGQEHVTLRDEATPAIRQVLDAVKKIVGPP